MLTIFSNPRPFRNHFNIIQRNAIQSWLQLQPRCEIILFGEEEGAAQAAAEFSIKYVPEIKKNKFGTPVMDSVFNSAQKLAKHPLMAYLSSDIILTSDFIESVKQVKEPKFLLVGQRIDLDIKEELDFNNPDWEKKLIAHSVQKGEFHGQAGSDYFVFPAGLFQNVPGFAIGRTIHDNWLIYKVRSLGLPVIDATGTIIAIHQNHSHSHCLGGEEAVRTGKEARENLKLAGGYSHVFSLRDANWRLTRQGIKKPKLTIKYFQRYFWTLPAIHPKLGSWPKIISLMLQPKRVARAILRRIKIL